MGSHSSSDRIILFCSLFLVGFTAVLSQVLLVRELLVSFSGNELSIGIILASWLVWTGLGSYLYGRFFRSSGGQKRSLAGLQCLLAVLVPLSVLGCRFAQGVFLPVSGEIAGPQTMLGMALGVLSGLCLVSGALFVAGSRACVEQFQLDTSTGTSTVYIIESVGSGFAGFVGSILLIPVLAPLEIAFLVGAINLCAASFLALRRGRAILCVIGFGVVGAGGSGLGLVDRVDEASLLYRWSGFQLLDVRDSHYANLVLLEKDESRILYVNGLVLGSSSDLQTAEESVHFALLQHPAPRRLLMVGGGLNGGVSQALAHPGIERLDYVELDPSILDLIRFHFPEAWQSMDQSSVVKLHQQDGRLYIQTSKEQWDVILLSLPDPTTALLNRYFTQEFFQEVKGRLNSGGVLSFSVSGSENYLSEELTVFLKCLRYTLETVFEDVVFFPGETIYCFASSQPGSLTGDPDKILSRLKQKGVSTLYVNENYLPFRLASDRMEELSLQTASSVEDRINLDFSPIAFYYKIVLWTSQFSGTLRRLADWVGQVAFRSVFLAVLFFSVLLVGVGLGLTEERAVERLTALTAVSTMGFTTLSLEVILLLALQVISGSLYFQLAVVLACFMFGAAVGSWRAVALNKRRALASCLAGREFQRLLAVEALIASLPLLLFAMITFFHSPAARDTVAANSGLIFGGLAMIVGGVGGYQFPLMSRLYFSSKKDQPSSNPGALYSADLLGACSGALVVSQILLPLFGFGRAALLVAAANLGPLCLLAFLTHRNKRTRIVA